MRLIQKLKERFEPDDFFAEVAEAYFHKLPQNLRVDWFRDSGYIVAKIVADGKEYRTQGKDAEDLFLMVNDCLYTAYGIKARHKEKMLHVRSYRPPQDEWVKLNDGKVQMSAFQSHLQVVKA
ncbi:MAG: hypothetical protein AAB554_01635 [Patescibacteria group bacterium]